jgi:hypothetical protein
MWIKKRPWLEEPRTPRTYRNDELPSIQLVSFETSHHGGHSRVVRDPGQTERLESPIDRKPNLLAEISMTMHQISACQIYDAK